MHRTDRYAAWLKCISVCALHDPSTLSITQYVYTLISAFEDLYCTWALGEFTMNTCTMICVATNIDMRLSPSPYHSMGTLNQHYATSIVHCVTLTALTIIVTSTCTQLVSGSSMSIGYADSDCIHTSCACCTL